MKTWVALGAVLLAAGPALAQQQEDPVESRVQRYKEQLSLTEEQLPKVREIVKKQLEDLKAVLTDEQKTRLDQGGGRGNRDRGGPPGQAGGIGGFRGGAWLPSTDDLKAQLTLTDDQVAKINEIRDAVRQQMRTFFQNRGRGGGQNLAEEWNAFQEKSKQETSTKIRELLTEEQKPKFEEALKKFSSQQPPADSGGRGRGGNSVDDRVNRAMENLKIEDAKEAEAVKSLVRKVAEAMEKLETAQRDSRSKIDEASRNTELSDDAVGDRITEILKTHRDLEKELAAARKALTEVVTNRQELELLRRGILR